MLVLKWSSHLITWDLLACEIICTFSTLKYILHGYNPRYCWQLRRKMIRWIHTWSSVRTRSTGNRMGRHCSSRDRPPKGIALGATISLPYQPFGSQALAICMTTLLFEATRMAHWPCYYGSVQVPIESTLPILILNCGPKLKLSTAT
jgi:hypothetical protein